MQATHVPVEKVRLYVWGSCPVPVVIIQLYGLGFALCARMHLYVCTSMCAPLMCACCDSTALRLGLYLLYVCGCTSMCAPLCVHLLCVPVVIVQLYGWGSFWCLVLVALGPLGALLYVCGCTADTHTRTHTNTHTHCAC
jgi:hypothetical protein